MMATVQETLLDPSSAHGSVTSQGSFLSKLSLQQHNEQLAASADDVPPPAVDICTASEDTESFYSGVSSHNGGAGTGIGASTANKMTGRSTRLRSSGRSAAAMTASTSASSGAASESGNVSSSLLSVGTELTTDSQGNIKKLGALGSSIRKVARELMTEDPAPPSEKRCATLLQHLLNLLKDHTIETAEQLSKNKVSKVRKDLQSNQEQAKAAAVKYGALQGVLCGMKLYPSNTVIQTRGVTILGLIAAPSTESNIKASNKEVSADYRDAIANVYGTSYILGMLVNSRENRKNLGLCMEACQALSNLCYNSTRNVVQFVEGDGITALRSIIHYHASKHAQLVQHCFTLLSNIAYQDTPAAGDATDVGSVVTSNSKRSASSGSRKQHRATLSFSGGQSILSTSSASTNNTNPISYQYLSHVEDPELMEAVVDLMGKHKSSKVVVQTGAHILYLLATKGSQRTLNSLTWGKAHVPVIKAMKSHKDNVVIASEGMKTLRALVGGRREAGDMVAEDISNLTVVLESMAAHPKKLRVQEPACQLLATLVANHPKEVAKAIKKNSPESKESLRNAKERFESQCASNVVTIIQCYNQQYQK